MNWPNVLTILRVILTCAFIYCVKQDTPIALLLAALFFTIAALTDFFDGYLARKYSLITPFGKIMDPLADKFLILSAFFLFMQRSLIAEWMFYSIGAREIIVTGMRFIAMRKGMVLAAENAGKLKTVLQIVAVYLIIIFTLFQPYMKASVRGGLFLTNYIVMCVVVVMTLFSGFSFIWNNRRNFIHVG